MISLIEDIRKLDWFRFYFPTHPSLATLYRYTTRGCRGVVLESVQIGNVRCTSVQAVDRFIERLSRRQDIEDAPPTHRTLSQRQRRSEAAAKELDRLGC